MEVIENILRYVENQKSQNRQMSCQLSMSQNRPVRLVPWFVGVHHKWTSFMNFHQMKIHIYLGQKSPYKAWVFDPFRLQHIPPFHPSSHSIKTSTHVLTSLHYPHTIHPGNFSYNICFSWQQRSFWLGLANGHPIIVGFVIKTTEVESFKPNLGLTHSVEGCNSLARCWWLQIRELLFLVRSNLKKGWKLLSNHFKDVDMNLSSVLSNLTLHVEYM